MRTARSLAMTSSVVVLAFALTACQSAHHHAASPSAGLIPISERLEQRVAEAMAGLVYEDERVMVDPSWPTVVRDEGVSAALTARGRGLLEQGRSLQAIRTLTDAALTAPHLAEPYHWLGHALISKGKTAEALAAFSTALELDGARIDSRYERALALHRLGRLYEAVTTWEDLLSSAPDHADTHARLAVAQFYLGNLLVARSHLEQAQRLGGPIPAHLPALLDRGEPPRAVVRDGGHPAASRSVVVGDQVRIDVGGGTAGANETTAASVDSSPLEVVAGWNDYRSGGYIRTGVGVSLDGGETWTDFLLRPPVANQTDVEGDPMTAFDQRTGTLWAGGMAFLEADGGVFVARKQPGSSSFEPAVMTIVDGYVDKGWMAAGPVPGVPDSTRLYLAYNFGLQHSADMGDTWSPVTWLGYGVGFLPRVGPDGELYIAYWDYGTGVMMRRSQDGGTTLDPSIRIATRMDPWDIHNSDRTPGSYRVPPLSYLAVDPSDGTLYCVYFDTTEYVGGNYNVDLYFTRSTDHGDTWTTPTVINGDSEPPGDQFFPWLEVDSAGRIHLLFYDTRNTVQYDFDPSGLIDAYYAYSDDRGDSWTEHRLTPAPFDTVYATSGGGQFIGDYSGLAVASDRVYPVYMSTQNGDRDIFTNPIISREECLFCDGFESGDSSAWSVSVGTVPR